MAFYAPNKFYKYLTKDIRASINELIELTSDYLTKLIEAKKKKQTEEEEKKKKSKGGDDEDESRKRVETKESEGLTETTTKRVECVGGGGGEEKETKEEGLSLVNEITEQVCKTFLLKQHHQQRQQQQSVDDSKSTDSKLRRRRISNLLPRLKITVKKLSHSLPDLKARMKNFALYFFVLKFLNLINVLLQFYALSLVFGPEFLWFGQHFFNKVLLTGQTDLFSTSQFPILTLCDYHVYTDLNKIHYNTAQCLLGVNIVIEKFYLIIWTWLLILLFSTVANILIWMWIIFFKSKQTILSALSTHADENKMDLNLNANVRLMMMIVRRSVRRDMFKQIIIAICDQEKNSSSS